MRSPLVAVSTALVALVVLGFAAPAAADEGDLYTAVTFDVDGDDSGFSLLAADGTVAPFAPTYSTDDIEVSGVEVFNGQGYFLARVDGEDSYVVGTWDVTTGVGSPGVPIDLSAFDPAEVDEIAVWGFDATSDGTLLVLLTVEPVDGADETWIARVDPITGALVPIVVLPEVFEPDNNTFYDSLATDPITGTTFVFVDDDNNVVSAIPVQLSGPTVGAVVEFGAAAKPDSWLNGADFDTSGVLWYLAGEVDGLTLSSLAGPGLVADWTNGTRTVVDVNGADADLESNALATWSPVVVPVTPAAPEPVAPELAATGVDLSVLGGVGFTLFAAGALLLVVRRRGVRAAN